MIIYVLNLLRIRWISGHKFVNYSVNFTIYLWSKLRSNKIFIPHTFVKANSIKSPEISRGQFEKITIVCVVTKKDFLTLPKVILSATKAIGHKNLAGIRIVVPDQHKLELYSLLKDLGPYKLEITTDEELMNSHQIISIRNHFGKNFSWIIQQLLKFESVRTAKVNCLILDSDTYILNEKYLRIVDGLQPLTPSEEFHKPYYDFLSKVSPLFANTEFSFVPHHQIVQYDIFNEMCEFLQISNLQDLIDICLNYADIKQSSPLCIDYELYAQYIFRKHPNRFILVKWSNISIANSKFTFYTDKVFFIFVLRKFYNSISFHSWS